MSVERVKHAVSRCSGLLLVALAAVALTMQVVAADEVTSKGTVLHGKVTGLSAAGVTFQPEYGQGTLAIKWADVENIKSEARFQVFYGADQESDAPLQGFHAGKLTVGTTKIDVAAIYSGVPLGATGLSFTDRMRRDWRYWDGNFDVGINAQQATTDSTGFMLAFKTMRSKSPTRFTVAWSYRYGTQKAQDGPRTRTADQLLGLVRGEYDVSPRIYAFASGDATYDGIQRVSIRGVPKLGVGYIIWQEPLDGGRRNFLQADVGGSWVYEQYFGGSTNDYAAVAFGALAGYYLPYGAHADWHMDYLPALRAFTSDYLLRNEVSLGIPLLDPVSTKFSVLDEYTTPPSPGTKRNSLVLSLGLSVGW